VPELLRLGVRPSRIGRLVGDAGGDGVVDGGREGSTIALRALEGLARSRVLRRAPEEPTQRHCGLWQSSDHHSSSSFPSVCGLDAYRLRAEGFQATAAGCRRRRRRIRVFRPPLLLLLPFVSGLDAYRPRAEGFQATATLDRRLRGVQGAVRVGLGMAEVSLGPSGGGGDSLCTRQSGRIGGCGGDKWIISKSPAKWLLTRIAYHAAFPRGINGASGG
jgi:hypothetical protein